jgi:peptide/nickel transport system substrate-binding protein
VEWVHNEKIVLERWEDYPWQTYGLSGPFQFDKIIYRFYPDSVTLRNALEAGEVDIATRGINKLDLQEMQSEDIVSHFYESQVRLMLMDQHYDYFANEKVRQAVAWAIDQEEAVEACVPMCEVNYGFFPHVYEYYQNDEAWLNMYPETNIEKAKGLMAEAGYADGFDTELWICNQYQTKENEMDLAVVIKEQLAKIGINVEINYVENAIFVEKRRHKGEMPMALIGWGEDYPDVDSYMNYIMGLEGSWAMSAGVYDEYSESLLEEGRLLFKGELNDPARKEVYDKVHELNAEKAYWVPLYVETRGHALRSWLKGYRIGPTYMFDFHLTPEMYKEAPSTGIP